MEKVILYIGGKIKGIFFLTPFSSIKHKLQTALLLMAVLSTTLWSCNKNDNPAPPTSPNSFTYDGKSYEIKSGVVESDGNDGPRLHHPLLNLITEGVIITDTQYAGSGNFIELGLTSEAPSINGGTYTFDSNGGKAYTFTRARIFINYNLTSQTGESHFFSAGSVIVSISGSVYTIDVDATADGKQVKAHFSGTLITV